MEPEWLSGKIGNREGLFPEAFVQPLEDSASAVPPIYDNAPKRLNISKRICIRFEFYILHDDDDDDDYYFFIPLLVKNPSVKS